MATLLDEQTLFLRKIGLALLAKPEIKLELIIMPRIL
jgi:hypothetical protein